MTRTARILLATAATAAVLFVGGPFLYINVIKDDAPDRLTLTTDTAVGTDSTVAPATGDPSGTWKISEGSVVGYRVKEVIFGQATEGVGRTSAVEGSVVIDGTAVTSADFVVQLATIVSDSDRRDGQFNSRIMDTAAHPTATFSLTSPISLPPDAATGAAVDATATGDLTLRGTTKSVTFPVSARLEGASVKITGTIPVVFAEWSIPNPSFGGITTEDNGDLEFLLVLAR